MEPTTPRGIEADPNDEVRLSWAERHLWRRVEKMALSPRAKRIVPMPLRHAALLISGLTEVRSLDRKHNREGRLPDDENVRVEAIWLTECFPPSYLDGLIDGLDSLHVGERWGDRPTAADHVRLYRSGAYAGGTLNLGFFAQRGEGVFGAEYVQTDLPHQVKRARGWLENVTPSLTVIAIQFEVTDEASAKLRRALRGEYRTELRTGRSGSVYVDPDNQRKDAMRLALDGVARECADWLHRHFPGAFANGLLGGDHPTCVFLTTKLVVPFARPEHLVKWLWVTEMDASHDAWDSKDWPGLHLRVPERDRERHRWWLAGRRGDFLADSTDDHQAAYGGATRQGWLNRIDLDMSLTLMLHATDSLLLGMHEAVARSRDTMGASATRKWNVRRLEALRSSVISFVRDVEPVASELSSPDWRVEERATFMPGPDNIFSVLRWSATSGGEVSGASAPTRRPIWSRLLMRIRSQATTPAEMPDPVAVPTLTTHLVDTIRYRARLLLEAERQHRDGLATVSALVASGESVRLDRRIFVLTVVLGVIAAVAALPSIVNVLLVALRLLGLDPGIPSFGSAPSPSP